MQEMYETYRDLVTFRMVYIKEAHASDSTWPMQYAKEKGIIQHQNYGQRCSVAEKMFKEQKLSIPCVVDDMEDSVNEAYHAYPDRAFLIRKDGRLAVAADRGPWGFKPAIEKIQAWLAEYKRTGQEPELGMPQEERAAVAEAAPEIKGDPLAPETLGRIVGQWQMKSDIGGNVIEDATLIITAIDGYLSAKWKSMDQETDLQKLAFEGDELRFERHVGGPEPLHYEGTIDGENMSGQYTGPFGTIQSSGHRTVKGEIQAAVADELSASQLSGKIQQLTMQLIQQANSGDDQAALKSALEAVGHAEALHKKVGQGADRAVALTHYNAACMYSRIKDSDSAFEHLNVAIEAGGIGTVAMATQIEGDSDLDNIRNDPRYAKALEKARNIDSP